MLIFEILSWSKIQFYYTLEDFYYLPFNQIRTSYLWHYILFSNVNISANTFIYIHSLVYVAEWSDHCIICYDSHLNDAPKHIPQQHIHPAKTENYRMHLKTIKFAIKFNINAKTWLFIHYWLFLLKYSVPSQGGAMQGFDILTNAYLIFVLRCILLFSVFAGLHWTSGVCADR